MRSLVSVVCAVVVVAACGRVPGGTINGDFKLYEAVSDRSQIAVIDSRSHAVERRVQASLVQVEGVGVAHQELAHAHVSVERRGFRHVADPAPHCEAVADRIDAGDVELAR